MNILSAFASLLLFFLPLHFIPRSFGWSQYEPQVGLLLPGNHRANGTGSAAVHWNLMVEPGLTMARPSEHGELSVLDYDPNRMAWLERVKDQLRPCLENRTLFAFPSAPGAGHPILIKNFSSAFGADFGRRTEREMSHMVQLHGRHQRLWFVNGQSPGPTLVAKEGDQIVLRLSNRLLLDSISLRLHGLSLRGQWFHGGTTPMQQCPLAVRSDMLFRLLAHPAGTHWYHGQSPDGHHSNGLLGALVVLPKEGMVPEDRDYVALLQDWPLVDTELHEEAVREGTAQWMVGPNGQFDGQKGDNKGEDTVPAREDGVWAILINQKGWHSRDDIRHRPAQLPWSRFRVGKGERIRFRLIHGGFRHPLVVFFERHRTEVVATDGTDLPGGPRKVDAVILFPGERLDLRVHMLREPSRPVYRMVVGLAAQFLIASPSLPVYALGELDYGEDKARASEHGRQNENVDTKLDKCRTGSRECLLLGCPFQPAAVGGNSSHRSFMTEDGRKFACISIDELTGGGKGTERQHKGNEETEKDGNNKNVDLEKHVIELDPSGRTVDGFHFRMPASSGPFLSASSTAALLGQRENDCSQCEAAREKEPCKCFYHKRFAKGKTVQITFVHKSLFATKNGDNHSSPPLMDLFGRSIALSMHGTKFEVLRIGYPIAQNVSNGGSSRLLANPELQKCFSRGNCSHFEREFIDENGHKPSLPVTKDTVLVPFGGFTVIRFRADNPGWWLAENQCKDAGNIKFAFVVENGEEMPTPPVGFPTDCGTFDPGPSVYEQFIQHG